MALQPSLQPLIVTGTLSSPHTLEIFLDYVCPYSKKIALTLDKIVIPMLEEKYPGKVKFIFRNQVQPWHSTSTLVHEAGLAVARVAPSKFWEFSLELFKNQDDYFDISTSNLSPTQIRNNLADLAAGVIGADKRAAFLDLITFKTTPNGGVDVTDDLKYTIKISRQNGIHVSPTILFDGLIVPEAGSAWVEKEWSEFFEKRITA